MLLKINQNNLDLELQVFTMFKNSLYDCVVLNILNNIACGKILIIYIELYLKENKHSKL